MDNFEMWLLRLGIWPLSLGLSFSDNTNFRDDWMELVQSYRECFWRLWIMDRVRLTQASFLMMPTCYSTLQSKHYLKKTTGWRLCDSLHLTWKHWSLISSMYCQVLFWMWDGPTSPALHKTPRSHELQYEAVKFLILLDCCPNLDWLIFGPATRGSHHPLSCSYPNLHMPAIILHGRHEDPIFNLILANLEFLKVAVWLQWKAGGEAHVEWKVVPFPLYDLADSSEQETPSTVGPFSPLYSIQMVGGKQFFAMFDLCWANMQSWTCTIVVGEC